MTWLIVLMTSLVAHVAPLLGGIVASDTASNPDPVPFWGAIECQSSSRVREVNGGGDSHPTAAGQPQGNTSYRRVTVVDGDNVAGERCELGKNDWRDSPVTFYGEGAHRVTYVSLRLPSNFPLDAKTWQVVMQMKQAEPSDVGGPSSHYGGFPALALDAYDGRWYLLQANQGDKDKGEVWSAPAQADKWTRFAFDVVYSTDPGVGSVHVYADLNDDGDFSDTGEKSALLHMATLQAETPGTDADGFSTGDPVPSHLRMGIYHNTSIPCPAPAGCSVDIDNVQVVNP